MSGPLASSLALGSQAMLPRPKVRPSRRPLPGEPATWKKRHRRIPRENPRKRRPGCYLGSSGTRLVSRPESSGMWPTSQSVKNQHHGRTGSLLWKAGALTTWATIPEWCAFVISPLRRWEVLSCGCGARSITRKNTLWPRARPWISMKSILSSTGRSVLARTAPRHDHHPLWSGVVNLEAHPL